MSTEINFESKDLNVAFEGESKFLVTFVEVGNQFVQFTGEDNFSVAFGMEDPIAITMDTDSFAVELVENNIESITFIEVQDLDIEFDATPHINIEFSGVGTPGKQGKTGSAIADFVFEDTTNSGNTLGVAFTEVVQDGIGTLTATVDASNISVSTKADNIVGWLKDSGSKVFNRTGSTLDSFSITAADGTIWTQVFNRTGRLLNTLVYTYISGNDTTWNNTVITRTFNRTGIKLDSITYSITGE